MDQQQLHAKEAKCTQESLPRCTATCPIHVDGRGIMAAVRKGDFSAGYALFAKVAPFPGIIGQICDHPCQGTCKRVEVGEGIAINALERACREYNTKPLVKNRVAVKNKKVAVVGAGISGLTVAMDLAKKGYKLTVFEAGDQFGGRLLKIPEAKLPRQIMADDFARLTELGVEAKFGVTVGNNDGADVSFNDLLTEFDAVYLGLGQVVKVADLQLGLELDNDGHIRIDPVTFGTSNPQVFAGGSHRQVSSDSSLISAISDGRSAAISIDRALQGASLTANRTNEGPVSTKLFTSTEGIESQPAIAMADANRGYSAEEAQKEAERCLDCQCMECVKLCEFMKQYKSFPRSYARQIYNNMSIVMGIHHANQMINSCSMCRLCEEVCQDNFSMADICREARETMVSKGKMPPSAFDFALRDLEYSNSDAFAMAKHEPGFSQSEVIFYPGCQLSGSAPEQVIMVYNYLREKINNGVGLMLGCCGAPADWAGQKAKFSQTIQFIQTEWERMGKPKVIVGCPTCFMIFKNNLPDIPVEFLGTFIERAGLPAGQPGEKHTLVIHDACTTRHQPEIHDSIRNILRQLGHEVEELKTSRELTECCGYGGLMQISNKELARKVVDRRISESDRDYVTYCAMCRDNFTNRGKKTYHLLDLIFGGARPPVGYSQRHENRARLKTTLLREVWGEAVQDNQAMVKLIISDKISEIMEDSLIMASDLQQVIEYAERTGNKLQNSTNGHFLAYYKPACVTYWVEYSPGENGFVIHDAYSHRIEITDQ